MPHALHLLGIFLRVVAAVTRCDVLGVVVFGRLGRLLVVDEYHVIHLGREDPRIQPKRESSNMKKQPHKSVYTCPLSSAKATFGGAPLIRSNRSSNSLPGCRVSRSEEHTSELQSRQYLVCR